MFLVLRQWKLVFALRTFSHFALHRRWTTRTSECPAIYYVEREAAFGTFHQMLRLRTHFSSLYINQPFSGILKTFLETFKQFNTEIIKAINSTTIKTVKFIIKKSIEVGYVRRN